MGFTTGFLGGVTLTSAILYLTVSIHSQNRVRQALLLNQQSLILNNIVAPQPPLPPPTSREVRAGLVETGKDRWNAELEGNVKKLQNMDWNGVRERMEEGASVVWRTAFRKSREAVSDAES